MRNIALQLHHISLTLRLRYFMSRKLGDREESVGEREKGKKGVPLEWVEFAEIAKN
jgi:hypothetical protein